MLWFKYLIATLLFYLFAVLQNSFFAQFTFMGAVPSMIFIMFFVLVFFSEKKVFYEIVFYSLSAGFFAYIYLEVNFGACALLFLIIAFLTKKSQELLKNTQNGEYPLFYFLPLFFVAFLVYYFLSGGADKIFSWSTVAEIVYNLIISAIVFFIYKKFLFFQVDTRQLKLFR